MSHRSSSSGKRSFREGWSSVFGYDVVKNSQVIECYARALLELSLHNRSPVLEGARLLLDMIEESESLLYSLTNPVASDKALVVRAMDGYIPDVLLKFLLIVIENLRASLIIDIVRSFITLARKEAGEIDIIITSALPATKADKEAISDALATSFGRVVDMENVVDTSIIGGFIVRIGFRIIDASLRGYLDCMVEASKLAMLEVDQKVMYE